MKKSFFLISLFMAFVPLVFAQNNLASASKVQGLYIFTDSEPLADYDVLGEITTTDHKDKDIINSGAQYQPVRDFLIKKARQTYYNGPDGLILTLINGGTDKAIVIKFKDNTQNKSQAKANLYQGLYIFVDSEPIKPIKYLGTVKSSFSFMGPQYSALKEKLSKKCKKDFPTAKGLIIKSVSGGIDTGDAVDFE